MGMGYGSMMGMGYGGMGMGYGSMMGMGYGMGYGYSPYSMMMLGYNMGGYGSGFYGGMGYGGYGMGSYYSPYYGYGGYGGYGNTIIINNGDSRGVTNGRRTSRSSGLNNFVDNSRPSVVTRSDGRVREGGASSLSVEMVGSRLRLLS